MTWVVSALFLLLTLSLVVISCNNCSSSTTKLVYRVDMMSEATKRLKDGREDENGSCKRPNKCCKSVMTSTCIREPAEQKMANLCSFVLFKNLRFTQHFSLITGGCVKFPYWSINTMWTCWQLKMPEFTCPSLTLRSSTGLPGRKSGTLRRMRLRGRVLKECVKQKRKF